MSMDYYLDSTLMKSCFYFTDFTLGRESCHDGGHVKMVPDL